MQFNEIDLSQETLSAIDLIGYKEMTEIQEKSIPEILKGTDVIGRSNTGTGKTAAFGIPVIEKINTDVFGVQALILCPTRELAQQATDEIKKFCKFKKYVKPVAIFGGVNIEKQIRQLKSGANLVIGTPGRIIDHINRRTLKLGNLHTIVLDEADEMLQMGFREDIENILQFIPDKRQTILFSATMPPEILSITKLYQNNPILIKTISKSKTVESINQSYYVVPTGKKFDSLNLLLMYHQPKSSMIFCNTKKMVDELTEMLVNNGYKAVGIHGDMKQSQRTTVMNSFKSGRTTILVATDVAARGIDVSGVDAVFNFDFPQDNEYYIHRIGRTGRAGKSGSAYTLICNRKQVSDLKHIAKNTCSEISECELPSKSDLISMKIDSYVNSIKNFTNEIVYQESYKIIDILKSNGWTYEDISLYIINNIFAKELKNVPDVKVIKYSENKFESGKKSNSSRKVNLEGLSKLNINIGRNKKISPNFILGALVDATGISGKCFGKIDIHDCFTTVEVPNSKLDYILKSMKNTKIRGNKVSIRKDDERKKLKHNSSGKSHKNSSRRYRKRG